MNIIVFIRMTAVAWIIGGLLLVCTTLRADQLVAIVEDLSTDLSDIEIFEYLTPGTTLILAENQWISLGYLYSCNQEKIVGGKIIIGARQSEVSGGLVVREKVQCDGQNLQLMTDQSDRAGVAVMRKSEGQMEVNVVIYSVYPLLHVTTNDRRVELYSVDRPGKSKVFDVKQSAVDFLAYDHALKRGGIYRIKGKDKNIVFRIDKFSAMGSGTFLNRLIIL